MEHSRCFQRLGMVLAVFLIVPVVRANTAPVAQCTNVTASAGPDCEISVSIDNGSYDPDGDPVTIVQSPAGPYPLGTTLVTLRITDSEGLWDQCQAIVTVIDDTPPIVTCPEGILRLDCSEPTDPSHTGYATLTDNCDPSPVLTYQDTEVSNSSSDPLIRTIFREWIGIDANGNVSDCVQPILLYDNTPPYYTFCPPNITIACDESIEPVNTGQAVGADDCRVDPELWYEDEFVTGSCPYEMTINRTWYLNDGTGSDDVTCLQIISVVDTEPPQLVAPEPVLVECFADVPAPDINLVVATDNCDTDPNVEYLGDVIEGVCPTIITRTYRATDACNNSALCTQIITVDDVTAPVVVASPPDYAFECLSEIPNPDPGLIVATDNCDTDLLIEHISDVSDGGSCPETITRTYRVTDACDNATLVQQHFVIRDLTPPVCTVPADQDIFLCEPQTVRLDIIATDNCMLDPVLEVVDGPGDIIDGQWCYEAASSTSVDVTIRATDICNNYCEDVFHVDITTNTAPQITNCPEVAVIHWGETFTYDFTAIDPDVDQTLTFDLCDDAPENATIDPLTGHLEWSTTSENICDPIICVVVTDDCGATDICEIEACVSNDPPVISCPEDQVICYGYPFEYLISADDPDNSQQTIFRLIDPPSGMTIDALSGAIIWDEPQPGTWDICAEASDGAPVCDPCSPVSADTCCFTLKVVALDLVIDKVHNQYQNSRTKVSIDFLRQGSNWPIAGYDLLIQYDASALMFLMVTEGQFLLECNWEYLSYRFGTSGNCGASACPTGIMRIIAIAETNGGNIADHPDCFTNDGIADPGPGSSTSTELAVMHFMVTDDRTMECQFSPIRFIWYGCGDNSLSNVSGDSLYISNEVYDYGGETGDPPVAYWNLITGLDNTFPTVTGAPAPDCNLSDKSALIRCANFHNGGVDIICADSIDATGDVNVNGIAYEIADAVMLTNYFIHGLSAFEPHVEGSIAATDANQDGLTLSVADLVYLIRVVIGDAMPYAKVNPSVIPVSYTLDNGVVIVSDNVDISGAALVVRGDVEPQLLVDGMRLQYAFDGTNTRIVVMPPADAATMSSFRGEFLGGIDGELISLELSTSEGAMVLAKNMPVRFSLTQNYPNPFNPVTVIQFALPEPVEYSLTIFNIQGQVVAFHESHADAAGVYQFEWDATEHASGVYLYRLEAGTYAQTKKMLLLK